MEDADELLLDEEFLDTTCLASEECVQELIADAGPGCLYCALGSLDDEDD